MIRLTCYHEVESLKDSYEVLTKGCTRTLEKAIDCKLVCKDCFEFYKKQKMVFITEKEAEEWLNE